MGNFVSPAQAPHKQVGERLASPARARKRSDVTRSHMWASCREIIVPEHVCLMFAEEVSRVLHIYHILYDSEVEVAVARLVVDISWLSLHCFYYQVKESWRGKGG